MLLDHCPVCLSVLSVCNVGVLWPNSQMDQDETWRVDIGPDHIVLYGDPAFPPPPKREFSAHVCCGQMAGWIKMPLGMEVGLGPGHTVLDGDPALSRKGHSTSPLFGPCLLWPNGRPSQPLLSTCYEFSLKCLEICLNGL